jgi:hypothetical protein
MVTNTTAEEKLAQALEEIQRLKEQVRVEAARTARYPWENPETVQEQGRMGYNLKIEPELYLKIQWLMENKGGIRSIQVFFDRAGNKLADEYLAELGAK